METNGIELQSSRNGLSIPVINGVYLHSMYNPQKEAEVFAEKHVATLKKKNKIMILGLGFGYHVEEVAKELNKRGEYQIIVIEPNKELVDLFQSKRAFLDSSIEIISYETAQQYYLDTRFTQFLSKKPGIIKLDTSFNINRAFFKSFLTYKADARISSYSENMNLETRSLFEGHEGSLFEITREIKSQRFVANKKDFLILALTEMANQTKEVSQ